MNVYEIDYDRIWPQQPPQLKNPGRITTEERFRKYVAHGKPDECWPWLGGMGASSGGHLQRAIFSLRADKKVYASHFAFLTAYGFAPDVPAGDRVLHAKGCLGGRCVNPFHLRIGTDFENARQRWEEHHERHTQAHKIYVLNE